MAKCRVFAIDEGLKEVVRDGLYMKVLLGQSISVSIVKFVAQEGRALPARSHAHGEEATLQITGGVSIFEGEGSPGDRECVMQTRSAVIIPADLPHYGINSFSPEGLCIRLNVVTPPRREFTSEDSTPYYPLKSRSPQA